MDEKKVKIGFALKRVKIQVSKLLPTKQLPPNISNTPKYRQTAISVQKIGIIEPLLVHKKSDNSGDYFLLDGHLRIQILDNLGVAEVYCLLSTEDEGFVANRFIKAMSPLTVVL
jgi:ParB-like chromosome segregation protein Spo0J